MRCTEIALRGWLLVCTGSPAILRGMGSIFFSGIPGPQGWGLSGDAPNTGTRQRRGLAGLDSLFLEEARTFGEGRRVLSEGGGEPVRGVGRKEGRVEKCEKSRSPFGFWTRLPLMGGRRFPVLCERRAPSASHSFAFASSPHRSGCLRPRAPPPPHHHLDIFSG